MVTCFRCKGESSVVLTRHFPLDEANNTIIRTRQCKSCKWKWKTIEIQLEREQPPNMKVQANASV